MRRSIVPCVPVPATLTQTIQAIGTRNAMVTAVAIRSTTRWPRAFRCSQTMSTQMWLP